MIWQKKGIDEANIYEIGGISFHLKLHFLLKKINTDVEYFVYDDK